MQKNGLGRNVHETVFDCFVSNLQGEMESNYKVRCGL